VATVENQRVLETYGCKSTNGVYIRRCYTLIFG